MIGGIRMSLRWNMRRIKKGGVNMSWIKKLFCKHDFRITSLILTNYDTDARMYECSKCGKIDWRGVKKPKIHG